MTTSLGVALLALQQKEISAFWSNDDSSRKITLDENSRIVEITDNVSTEYMATEEDLAKLDWVTSL